MYFKHIGLMMYRVNHEEKWRSLRENIALCLSQKYIFITSPMIYGVNVRKKNGLGVNLYRGTPGVEYRFCPTAPIQLFKICLRSHCSISPFQNLPPANPKNYPRAPLIRQNFLILLDAVWSVLLVVFFSHLKFK